MTLLRLLGEGAHQPLVDTVVLHPDPLFKANISIPKLLGTSSVNLTEKDFGWMDLLCPRLHPRPGHTQQSVTG